MLFMVFFFFYSIDLDIGTQPVILEVKTSLLENALILDKLCLGWQTLCVVADPKLLLKFSFLNI